jgi:hippurate hydrolase
VLRGTARSYKPEVRKLVVRRLRELADSLAQAYGCSAECEIGEEGSPSIVNSPAETAHAVEAAKGIAGEQQVNGAAPPATWSEDFANYLGHKPGAFVRIGNRGSTDHQGGLHTPAYDFNDRVLPVGAGYWVKLVETELSRP